MGKKRIWISWALAISMLISLASCGESGETGESVERGEMMKRIVYEKIVRDGIPEIIAGAM